jgi:hypothetical protein
MAKIAGRKNDGAWYRWNKWILHQPTATQAAFTALFSNTLPFTGSYTVIKSYMVDTGVQTSAFPSTAEAWALELSIGVPRQIWDGVTTYDYYDKTGGGGVEPATYTKTMQPLIFALSVEIRAAAKKIRFGEEEVSHLAGLTRPPAERIAGETVTQTRVRRLAELKEFWVEHGEEYTAQAKLRLTRLADKSKSTPLRPRQPQPKGRVTAASRTV